MLSFVNVSNSGVLGLLPDGRYEVTLKASSITDMVGNSLDHDVTKGFSFLIADFDNNGAVIEFDDLLILAQHYGQTSNVGYREGDATLDGRVDFDDLLILAQHYHATLPVVGVNVVSRSISGQAAPIAINFGFNVDVNASLSASDLQLMSLTTGLPIASSLFDVRWDTYSRTASFVGTRLSSATASGVLPDGRYRATLPAGSVSSVPFGSLLSDQTYEFVYIAADFDGDGSVTFTDLLSLAQHYGQTAGATHAGGDANYDGKVDFSDLLLLAQRYGSSVLNSGEITPAIDIAPEIWERYFPGAMLPQAVKAASRRKRTGSAVVDGIVV
jgi:hypothetical protein